MFGGGGEMMMGGMGDEFDDDEEGNQSAKEIVETQLLLGDRNSQEIGEMFTMNLFKAIEGIERFAGMEGMTLQLHAGFMRNKDKKI